MQSQSVDYSIVMLSHRRVAYWLVLAAVLLLVIGTFTLERIRRDGISIQRNDQIRVSQLVVASSSALAIVSVLIAGLQVRAEAAQRRQVELMLQEALASVEQQVAERTDALSSAMVKLTESEQLKNEFLATASHELRTPLNAIVGWVHVLQSGVVDQVQRQHAITAIDRNAKSLTRLIAEQLSVMDRGTLIARSAAEGHGPHVAGGPPPAASGVSGTDSVFQNLHVLVAEDDADSAAAVTAILRLHGCETHTAGTAAECLRIAGEWPTDVLVCDIGLPDDDGYGLLERLRKLPEGMNIPAIALTAYARPEDREKALAAGFRAHLSKPLDPASLLREIASAVSA